MKLGLIGCGKMGGALLRGALKAAIVKAKQVVVYDKVPAAIKALQSDLPGLTVAPEASAVSAKSDVVLLAVKPQDMQALLESVTEHGAERSETDCQRQPEGRGRRPESTRNTSKPPQTQFVCQKDRPSPISAFCFPISAFPEGNRVRLRLRFACLLLVFLLGLLVLRRAFCWSVLVNGHRRADADIREEPLRHPLRDPHGLP